MKYKFYPKAILLGAIIDLLLTAVMILVVMIGLIVTKIVPLQQFSDHSYFDNIPLMAFFMAIGLGCSFLGGFITAKKSLGDEGFNCIIMGLFGLVAGIIFFNSSPVWYSVSALIVHMPIIYVGGIVAKKGKLRKISQ
jgi:hypothetical protein